HYFSVWQGRSQYDTGGDIGISPHDYNFIDYGLSMTKLVTAVDGAFLSSQVYDCGGTGTCDDAHPDRSTYVLYEHHKPAISNQGYLPDPFDVVAKKTRSVFEKDLTATGAAYIDVSS